ncbi:MAG: CsgG/HfaB family protein [Methylococcaceae bacterium]|nr:CsgG/HfaB family protein [Methylococcaceae bacterium]MCI0733464.1 CsgG/HfaB family protein [Methylococcaceae bacterium]
MRTPERIGFPLTFVALILLVGCASESHRTIEPQTTRVSKTAYYGPKSTLVVGKFQNRSDYLRGIFYEGYDRLGNQAKTILKTHLQQSGRFIVVDRDNMDEITQESGISATPQSLKGAGIVITGDVTEFGRKVTGDTQLFGILGHGKTQLAYAKVALNVVEVKTSEILFSAQGAGEYDLSNRQIIGTGSSAGYDATLNGKVLNLAIMEAVNNLVDGLDRGRWSP